jgi:chromosome segregation ATPase
MSSDDSATTVDWKAKFIALQAEFNEFQEFSKDYETELETEVGHLTSSLKALKDKESRSSSDEKNARISELEGELRTLHDTYTSLQESYLTEQSNVVRLEQKNEEMEQQLRTMEVCVHPLYIHIAFYIKFQFHSQSLLFTGCKGSFGRAT